MCLSKLGDNLNIELQVPVCNLKAGGDVVSDCLMVRLYRSIQGVSDISAARIAESHSGTHCAGPAPPTPPDEPQLTTRSSLLSLLLCFPSLPLVPSLL